MRTVAPPPLALAYHGVAAVPLRQDRERLFVAPDVLVRQVERLRKWGYTLVSFGDLARLAVRGEAAAHAALTFDDGFVDNLEQLVPLTEAEGFPATVFVVSGWLGQRHPAAPWTRVLTEHELRELDAAGAVEVGAHTDTHPDLTALDPAAARAELATAKERLEAVLGRRVDVASYPFGRASVATAEAARAAGFVAACAASGHGDWANSHLLPREDVENGASLLALRLKRDGLYEPLMRRRAGRALRRVHLELAARRR
jgi:peptidoglycan/xylan/chitin deacetylase (PgdA/CDA1 family)